MKNASTVYVGMDVHTAGEIRCARVVGGTELVDEWGVGFERRAVERVARRLVREAGGAEVHCVYEAGPPGFTVKRWMEGAVEGLTCHVAAPSLILRAPGDRVKTDRRDARKLVRDLRAGILTFVYPPTEKQESDRALVRLRDGARIDQQRSKQRVRTYLLTRGYTWAESSWTKAHRKWLNTLELSHLDRYELDELLIDLDHHEQRMSRLDAAIEELAQTPAYRDAVGRLRCLRGVDTLTALGLVVTIHNPERFHSPRALMAYLGFGVAEQSSGERIRRGRLTKTGDRLARRLLIEAAKNQRAPYRRSKALLARRRGQPAYVIAYADRAGQRLSARYRRLISRGMLSNIATAAIAREMVGFVWALLQPAALRPLLTAKRG